jgi:shikimate dehydrogenase
MLVAQAVKASEIFLNTTYPEGTLNKIFRQIERSKENIVLIGMPSSGKTTVGKILAKKLSRELYDSDEKITNDFGSSIPDIFEKNGEEYFRELESNAIKELSKKTASVIATGGGAVLRRENIEALAQNGVIYFIDRPLESLMPTEDRPTASTREMIEKRHRERLSLYRSSANVIIDASATADEVANRIIEDFCK